MELTIPGKRHSKETKALAIAAATAGGSEEASEVSGVPARTIRDWMHQQAEAYGRMEDSELDSLIASKKRLMAGMWTDLGLAAQEFAAELREAGDPKGFLAVMTAAGIATTKLEALGNPKNVTPQTTSERNPLLVPHRSATNDTEA